MPQRIRSAMEAERGTGVFPASPEAGKSPDSAEIAYPCRTVGAHFRGMGARVAILAAALAFTPSVGNALEKPCRAGSYDCPRRVALSQAWFATSGRLARKTPDFAWKFYSKGGNSFQWRYAGPAVRVILTPPNGDTAGPGLPSDTPLTERGYYVFAIASNTMAEQIYGRFRIRFRLATTPDVKNGSQN